MMIKNLGPRSLQMLKSIGVCNSQDLKNYPYAEMYIHLKQKGFNPSLNLFYAIEMGLQNKHWKDISITQKTHIKKQIEAAKKTFQQ